MAPALTAAEVRSEVRRWHRRAFSSSHGPSATGDEQPSLRGWDLAAYRVAIRRAKVKLRWSRRLIRFTPYLDRAGEHLSDGEPKLFVSTWCEHCLRKSPVLLTRPGIVSGNKQGDFVCAECDSRVATKIALLRLAELVGV